VFGVSGVVAQDWPKAILIVAWGNAPGSRESDDHWPKAMFNDATSPLWWVWPSAKRLMRITIPGVIPQATMSMAFGHYGR